MSKDIRDQIRAKAFKAQLKKETYDLDGTAIEIRQPSRGEWESIINRSEGDNYKLQLLALIDLCYVPNTNNRIFEETDMESLKKCPVGGFVDDISKIILSLCNVEVDAAKKS